jgi:predicted chitinase
VKEATTREAAVEPAARASAAPRELDGVGSRVLDLQRSAGNAYVGRLVRSLQRDTVAPAATAWGAAYLPTAQQTFEQKLQDVSAPAATSAAGEGTPASGDLTLEQLFEIYTGLAKDAQGDEAIMEKAEHYLERLNEAFRLLQIDTVEARAVFLAHAFVEGDQFRRLYEAPAGQRRYMEYPDVPQKLDVKGLETLYPTGTERRRTIDPIGDWSFIGRGPLQVTHRLNYIEVLAYLEKAADAASSDDAATIREAIEAIKADPREASNPAYTFLFSAAFMKTEGGDVLASRSGVKTFGGKGSESYWMTGGHADPQAAKKLAAYGRALKALGGS